MMEEQQLPLNVRERTRVLDITTKWQMIRMYEQSLLQEKSEKNQPGYWVEKLQNASSQIWKDPQKMQRLVNTIKSQTKTWCVQLLRDKGLSALLEGFHQCKTDEVKVFALKAVNALISTRAGLEAFLALPAAIQPLVTFSLSSSNDCRFEIFEFLATAVGFSPEEGLPTVLEAMTSPQTGRIPFKPFVEMLTSDKTSHGVRFKLLVLINAIVNTADLLEDRQRSRQLLRSAEFGKALLWLRSEVNHHRAAIDGSTASIKSAGIASPSIAKQNSVGAPTTAAQNISLEEARANRGLSQAVFNAPGTNATKVIDQSEIWEMIRVQIELYEHSEEDDSLDATRNGVDFGSIDQLLEYVRVHMAPHIGQYLLPLLQMICILPLDTQKGQTLWSAVLTVVKRVIGAYQANETLSLDQLFELTENYAKQANMTVSDAVMNEKQNLEAQVNQLREKIRELESRPTPVATPVPIAIPTPVAPTETPAPAPSNAKEMQQLKAEMLGLRTQLSQATRELEALKAAPPAAPTTAPPTDPAAEAVAAVAAATGAAAAEALTKALAQITQLQAEIARQAAGPGAGGAAAGGVATGPTTITINTPEPPVLPGFNKVPHQPRTVVIPAGAPLPAGAAPAGEAGAAAAAAPAAPTSNIPPAPVLTGFTPVAGSASAGGAAPTAGAAPAGGAAGGANQPDGKPWPPVLPGFTAQPGAPNAGGAAGGAAGRPAAAAAPPEPVEPPIKLPYTRKQVKPAAKMRQMHWARLEDKVIENTIWFKLNDGNIKFNNKEVEAMFCQAAPKAASEAPAAGKPAAPVKQQEVTFVEGQRGQNMAIAVTRFRPLTYEQIRDAVLQVDTKTLSLETALSLSKNLPTPEEIEAVNSYDGPVADLAKTDQYIMVIGKIPALERRVEAFVFKHQYDALYNEMAQKVTSCSKVIKQIADSKALLRVLEYVLAMGNYMNSGTKKGDAYGFEISYLTQLANTRSCDNKTNLLQYLVPIWDTDPQTISLQDTFDGIEEVARLDIQQITTDISKFQASINKISALIKQSSAKPTPGDRFADVMTPFVASLEPKAKDLQAQLQTILETAKKIATSYGEEPGKFSTTQIFGLYNDFNKQVIQTRADLKRQAELKEKQEKMAAAAAARAAGGGGAKPGVVLPASTAPTDPTQQTNALMAAFANRGALRSVPPKAPSAEDEVASQVNATLTGTDAGSVLAAVKAQREARAAQHAGAPGGSHQAGAKRRSVFDGPK